MISTADMLALLDRLDASEHGDAHMAARVIREMVEARERAIDMMQQAMEVEGVIVPQSLSTIIAILTGETP